MKIDRSAAARALAKAVAYKECGKDAEASMWASELVRLLECAEILEDNQRAFILGRAGTLTPEKSA